MSKIISDIGNRKRISNVRDGINVLSISNRKNISDKPDSVNSIISVPRNKFLMPYTKKKTDDKDKPLADKTVEKVKPVEKVDKDQPLADEIVEKVKSEKVDKDKPAEKVDKDKLVSDKQIKKVKSEKVILAGKQMVEKKQENNIINVENKEEKIE